MKRLLSIILIAIFIFSFSTVAMAEEILNIEIGDVFEVQGISMSPELEVGDKVMLLDSNYENEDIVLAKTKFSGDMLVKRYRNGMLVSNSIGDSFKGDEVVILGKVGKVLEGNVKGEVFASAWRNEHIERDVVVSSWSNSISSNIPSVYIADHMGVVYTAPSGWKIIGYRHGACSWQAAGSSMYQALNWDGGNNIHYWDTGTVFTHAGASTLTLRNYSGSGIHILDIYVILEKTVTTEPIVSVVQLPAGINTALAGYTHQGNDVWRHNVTGVKVQVMRYTPPTTIGDLIIGG